VSSRGEEKNRRRVQPVEAERAAGRHASRRRRARWLVALFGGAAVAASVLALAVSTSPSPSSASTRPLSTTADAIAGLQSTPAPWPAEYTFLAQRLAGLALPAQSDSAYHIHAFLSIFINGRQITIPTNIGIDPQQRFLAPIHTHDSAGIVHIESSRPYPFTLGQLFTIWGVKFSDFQIGAYHDAGGGHLTVFANGRGVRDPVHYVMRRHDSIVVGYGTPASFPHRIAVTFPPGL
jgi:hypothetical protein